MEIDQISDSSVGTHRTNALSERSRRVIWARAAGRCQYPGCNKLLIGDLISGSEDKNFGFVAHIVADTPGGPRGDAVRSRLLSDNPSNLMLMCYPHHKLIDVDDVTGHAEDRLLALKAAHEARVEIVTELHQDRASHVLRYSAGIGSHESPVRYEDISAAMLPNTYPAEGRRTIDIELRGLEHHDDQVDFWQIQSANLRSQFAKRVSERVQARDVSRLSVFALAPQPLLIELGRLLGDITPADVYQLHREPKGWRWAEDLGPIEYRLRRPSATRANVALVLALSATITDDRVVSALGEEVSIWSVEALKPHNDVMRRVADLAEFRRLMRSILNDIKAHHGEQARINLFPALPVSAAVEVGRVWMPKADLPMVVFDQNRRAGFVRALDIE